jgi:hypothetical protein
MFKQVIDLFEILDSPQASGEMIADYLNQIGSNDCIVKTIGSEQGSTDFLKIKIVGSCGKSKGGDAPTIGIVGRLGGLGARPGVIGFVSDGDGALAALAVASKLVKMKLMGDTLKGDVIISTHVCPDAPTIKHDPVDFMDSPVDMRTMNEMEVDPEMDALLTVDTTKGNKIINTNGFAISNTVKEGYILKISDDLLNVMMQVTGKMPFVFPLSQLDITPYENNLYHINSILQPATATSSPVVGVAITTEVSVAGCSSGATNLLSVEQAARYLLEVAKGYTAGSCSFYDQEEFDIIQNLYGSNCHFQTAGKNK